jgi:hypothetical protein
LRVNIQPERGDGQSHHGPAGTEHLRSPISSPSSPSSSLGYSTEEKARGHDEVKWLISLISLNVSKKETVVEKGKHTRHSQP